LQEVGEDAKKKEGSMAGPSPLWLGDELEFWPEKTMGAPMRYETTLLDSVFRIRILDPGFGAFLTPGSGIRDG
jgi:hypothetical protein